MEKVIFLHIFGLLFLTRGVGTSSVAVALFNDLSEKLVDLNLSFNTNINSIHERLNKIEGAIGIGEKNVDSDGDPVKAELDVGQTVYSDIIKTKERFMKALESEKRYMRKLVKENEEKFDNFKYDIMNTVSTISLTVQELNKTLVTGTDQSEIVADILNIQNRVATIENYRDCTLLERSIYNYTDSNGIDIILPHTVNEGANVTVQCKYPAVHDYYYFDYFSAGENETIICKNGTFPEVSLNCKNSSEQPAEEASHPCDQFVLRYGKVTNNELGEYYVFCNIGYTLNLPREEWDRPCKCSGNELICFAGRKPMCEAGFSSTHS